MHISGSKVQAQRINGQINVASVRLIDQDGVMIGVVDIKVAMQMAADAKLDLVEISAKDNPPVCKILNYSRYKYDIKKKKVDIKKKNKCSILKEMRFKPNIGKADFQTKERQIRAFLEDGNKVKVSMIFRGREIVHTQQGMKLIEKLLEDLSDVGKVDVPPKLEGKQILVFLLPFSNKK
ncbi:translation initiation factor IF-3 [Candidatus Sarmatiella mevalonica]|uniref:translation initiation factor IF-3 n=1 Tax=Candidatus Sarmatiella mevalonica TaxID=2770581 RepID=UPI001FC8D9D1|nr:translation initiation factor IF-3 [Candidatus Sarmatiella mevalonica]